MYLAQPSSLDMLVLVGKVSCAAWRAAQENLLHEYVWCAWPSELASLFCEWRTASSRLSRGVRVVGAGSEMPE